MHSRCRAGRERTVSNSQRFLSSFRRPVTWCVTPPPPRPKHCGPNVQCPSHAPSLLSCPLLSLSPSLPPATFVPFNVANDCRSSFFPLFLMLHFSLLVLTPSLSLCPSSPSQPPTTPFSFSPPAHCHLLVPAQAPSRGLREAEVGVRQNVHL